MSTKETALEVFNKGLDEGTDRDTVIVSMVQAGVSLNSAQNWYKEFAVDAGIATKRVGYRAEALEFIAEQDVDITDNESRSDLRSALQDKFGVASSTANDYIKAYASDNNIDLPVSNFGADPEGRAKIFDWICQNPNCEKGQFRDFMKEEMNRGQGSIDETWRGIVLARDLQGAGVTFAETAEAE